jgi:hypothetical protein
MLFLKFLIANLSIFIERIQFFQTNVGVFQNADTLYSFVIAGYYHNVQNLNLGVSCYYK